MITFDVHIPVISSPLPVQAKGILFAQVPTVMHEETIIPLTAVTSFKDSKTMFTLTELTSDEELERISKVAEEAGITFHFHVQHHFHTHKNEDPRNPEIPLIRDFKAEMTIKGTNTSSQIKVRVPKRGKFELTFGWYLNEKGKAVRLTDDILITNALLKHPKG